MNVFFTNLTKKIANLFHLIIMKKDSFYTIPIRIDLRAEHSRLTPLDVVAFQSKHQDIKYIMNIPKDKIILRKIMEIWVEMLKIRENEDSDLKMKERPSFLFFKNFFATYQPKTVIERFELELQSTDERQRVYFTKPALYLILPWDNQSPEEEYNMYLSFMKREFEEHNGDEYVLVDGWKGFGPSSDRLIEMEYKRLVDIYESIQKHGYLEKFGFPFIEIYVQGDEYKVALEGAWHRTAILYALEGDSIPVVVKKSKIINRSAVKNWPHVTSKLYTEEQALIIFDSTFNSSLK